MYVRLIMYASSYNVYCTCVHVNLYLVCVLAKFLLSQISHVEYSNKWLINLRNHLAAVAF